MELAFFIDQLIIRIYLKKTLTPTFSHNSSIYWSLQTADTRFSP